MATNTIRIHPYISHDTNDRLQAMAAKPGRSASSIVEAALLAYMSFEHDDKRDGAIIRRLDRTTRQIEGLHRKQIITAEAFALFVRYFLTVIPQVAESDRRAAQSEGHARFETYLKSLETILQDGEAILFDRLEDQLVDQSAFFTKEELSRLHQDVPNASRQKETANA